MGWVWTQSITVCILAPILATNIWTSCDGRLLKEGYSWDPRDELDYMNPTMAGDMEEDTYRNRVAPWAGGPYESIAAQPSDGGNGMVSEPPAKPPSQSQSQSHTHHYHRKGHSSARFPVWCVARPTVPEAMLQKAMDYACATGADYCNDILPNGSCFVPNSLFAHASFAFNKYWQSTKYSGGTCDFGATAMLITVDPSFDGCQFNYN